MKPLRIIAGVLIRDNQILLLKRTKKRESYPNKWNVLSAKIEEDESPRKCLDREIKEEIGITRYEIIKEAKPYIDIQKEGKWLVYPYLCRIMEGEIKLDKKEHDIYEWISISDLDRYDLVPGIKSDLEALNIL